jgi:predicted DNA-binding transcriptional regulator YafY
MRSDRLLSILLLLQGRGRQTARQLAKRLEVSERTIQRDLDALSAAGVPVFSERGRHGGAALLEGFRTDVSGLTPTEARALLVFGGRGALGEPGLERDLQAALRKLVAALPESSRPEAIRAQERVVVDSRAWRRGGEEAPHLATVQEAVWSDRQLRLSYRAAGRTAPREQVVDPWGAVVKAGIWYLVAALAGEPRLYRVSRIEAAEILEEASRRPAGLDLEAVWGELRKRLEGPGDAVEVELRVRPDRVDLLLRLAAAQLARPVEGLPAADASGWARLGLTFVAEGAARAVLLGFGDDLEVLAPESLRRSLADTARAVLALYDGGTPHPPLPASRARIPL